MKLLSIPITALAVTVRAWEDWRQHRRAAATAHADAVQAEAIARCRGRDSWHDDDERDCSWCD